jgi:hypothetical protein
VNAQVAPKSVAAKIDRNEIRPVSKKGQNSTKVEGQQWWANGFNSIADWTQVNGLNHQGGDWDILTAIPSGITGQQAAYQWPSTFGGASGSFAFINSDAAGAGVAQDAYFQFTGTIDLSGAGSAAMYLTFAEYYRNYYDETFVEISNDGGANWVTFEVNPEAEVPVNTNCVPNEVEVVNITPAMIAQGGTWSNQVKVRFHYKGVYDWFWGIDDVKIVEAWNNDVKVTNWYQATDVNTTFGLDYYHVPVSQSSFPGWTFGALGANNGGQNQPTVALSATATGAYVATGSPVAIPTNSGDTLSISTPYLPTGLGTKTIELTTTLGANTDAALANNEKSMDVFLTNYEFSRDNNVIESSIGQISSQDGQSLKIGNVHEIFNDMDVTAIKVYLATQGSGAVGSEYFAELYKWNSVDGIYEYLGGTVTKFVTGTTAGWSILPVLDGPVTLFDGDDILVVACHSGTNGSATVPEVRFGLAQTTVENTVLGFDANGDLFSLTSPNAVMIRLVDDPSASINEIAVVSGINVFPNPAINAANVSIELSNDAAVAINVTDLSGKVVYSTNLGTVNGKKMYK